MSPKDVSYSPNLTIFLRFLRCFLTARSLHFTVHFRSIPYSMQSCSRSFTIEMMRDIRKYSSPSPFLLIARHRAIKSSRFPIWNGRRCSDKRKGASCAW